MLRSWHLAGQKLSQQRYRPIADKLAWLRWFRILLGLLSTLPLTACAKPEATVAVSVTAVNYTDQELNAVLFINPNKPNQVAGGPGVKPYEGMGTLCCISLPRTWHPGTTITIRHDWWNGSLEHRDFIEKTYAVPRYQHPATLWALFYPDGSIQILSTDLAPGHPHWPGKINSWPQPSLDYQRKLWQKEYDMEQKTAEIFLKMATTPSNEDLQKSWDHRLEAAPLSLTHFKGPNDPEFVKKVKAEFQGAYDQQMTTLKELEAKRP